MTRAFKKVTKYFLYFLGGAALLSVLFSDSDQRHNGDLGSLISTDTALADDACEACSSCQACQGGDDGGDNGSDGCGDGGGG